MDSDLKARDSCQSKDGRNLQRKVGESRSRGEFLELIFSHLTDAIFVIEPDGSIIDANPAACREELLDCIRRVNRGETCIPASLVEKVAAGLSSEALTGRELYVLELLAQGKSNKEIGVSLYISETTVKSHLRSIFKKLNVLSRTEAISVASRRGLIRL